MKSILFICALPQEKEALLETFDQPPKKIEISSKLSLSVDYFATENLNIYISESGMGNVNAGSKLTLILENLEIDQIFLIGVGGALTTDLEIGDMIISDKVIQHDYFSSLDDGNFVMKPGDLILSKHDAEDYDPVYTSIKTIFDITEIDKKEITIKKGLISSGCEFVGTTKRKKEIHNVTNALLVDMEACAIAQVATKYSIPFIIAKTVSDKLNPDGSIESDFQRFLKLASRNAAMIAIDVIAILGR